MDVRVGARRGEWTRATTQAFGGGSIKAVPEHLYEALAGKPGKALVLAKYYSLYPPFTLWAQHVRRLSPAIQRNTMRGWLEIELGAGAGARYVRPRLARLKRHFDF